MDPTRFEFESNRSAYTRNSIPINATVQLLSGRSCGIHDGMYCKANNMMWQWQYFVKNTTWHLQEKGTF